MSAKETCRLAIRERMCHAYKNIRSRDSRLASLPINVDIGDLVARACTLVHYRRLSCLSIYTRRVARLFSPLSADRHPARSHFVVHRCLLRPPASSSLMLADRVVSNPRAPREIRWRRLPQRQNALYPIYVRVSFESHSYVIRFPRALLFLSNVATDDQIALT